MIFSRVGTYGNISYVGTEEKFCLGQNVALIHPKINAKFLYYYLSSHQAKNQIELMIVGSTQKTISLKNIGNIEIPIHSEETQQKIAAILSALDAKIENNNAINKNLEAQAQALFKSWFVDFEPFGGVMPEGWREYCLSDFLPVVTGKMNANVSSQDGLYPFFSCSQDILWTNKYSFDGSAILVAGNGDFNVKWYNGKFEAYQRTYVLMPFDSKYTAWLYYTIKHNLNYITRAARGSVIKFITKGNLEKFSFFAPIDLENESIFDVFTTINSQIEKKVLENTRLAALRDTLLPKLMSAEIEV